MESAIRELSEELGIQADADDLKYVFSNVYGYAFWNGYWNYHSQDWRMYVYRNDVGNGSWFGQWNKEEKG